MRLSILTLASRASILAGIALAALGTTTELLAGPDPLVNCVYQTTCTDAGYSVPNYTCSTPMGSPPATAGLGTGSNIFVANGLCGTELNAGGIPTGFGCGDAAAVMDPEC